MIPFKEVTIVETGLKHRIPWDRAKADAKMQEFRRNATTALNARDIERARAAGVELGNGETVLRTLRDDGRGKMVVDPIASKVKHSGAEQVDAWVPQWRAFCSVPQNDDGVEYPCADYKPKQLVKVRSPVVATPVAALPRRPGRPRKQAAGAL